MRTPLLLLSQLTLSKDMFARESEQMLHVCFDQYSPGGLSGHQVGPGPLSLSIVILRKIVFASLFHKIAYKDLMKSHAEVLVNRERIYQANISILIIAEVCRW